MQKQLWNELRGVSDVSPLEIEFHSIDLLQTTSTLQSADSVTFLLHSPCWSLVLFPGFIKNSLRENHSPQRLPDLSSPELSPSRSFVTASISNSASLRDIIFQEGRQKSPKYTFIKHIRCSLFLSYFSVGIYKATITVNGIFHPIRAFHTNQATQTNSDSVCREQKKKPAKKKVEESHGNRIERRNGKNQVLLSHKTMNSIRPHPPPMGDTRARDRINSET